MIAQHYKPELADTIYQDVFFSISGDQFADDADLTHEVEGRIHELDDARQQAQNLANTFKQDVEVAVYGTWGLNGMEYVESFKVQPEVSNG